MLTDGQRLNGVCLAGLLSQGSERTEESGIAPGSRGRMSRGLWAGLGMWVCWQMRTQCLSIRAVPGVLASWLGAGKL